MNEVKPTIEKYFKKRNILYYRSDCNFMLVSPPKVKKAVDFLKSKNILVKLMNPPLEHTFRLSLRMMSDMETFMDTFDDYLKSQ